jgi:hypothetical protein
MHHLLINQHGVRIIIHKSSPPLKYSCGTG